MDKSFAVDKHKSIAAIKEMELRNVDRCDNQVLQIKQEKAMSRKILQNEAFSNLDNYSLHLINYPNSYLYNI